MVLDIKPVVHHAGEHFGAVLLVHGAVCRISTGCPNVATAIGTPTITANPGAGCAGGHTTK
jgi:hypothetical protein